MFMFTLRMIILLAALAFYILWLREKGLETAFAPVIAVSGISLVMFIAGLLNIMPLAVMAVLFGGYFCGYLLYRKKVKILPPPRVIS